MIWQMDSLLILSVRPPDGENVKKGTSGSGQSERSSDIESVKTQHCLFFTFFFYLPQHKRNRSTYPFLGSRPQDFIFYTVK